MKRYYSFTITIFCFLLTFSILLPKFAIADDRYEKDNKYEEEKYFETDDENYENGHSKYDDEPFEHYEVQEKYEEEQEKYEENEDYEKSVGEYQDDRQRNAFQTNEKQIEENWMIWSRSSFQTSLYDLVPIQNMQNVSIFIEGKKPKFIQAYPEQGQIFVPLSEIAEYMGATVIQYDKLKVAEVFLDGKHLIVKLGSRAVYENMKKTPIPLPISKIKDELYIPISVIANSMGYQVRWDQQIILEREKKE